MNVLASNLQSDTIHPSWLFISFRSEGSRIYITLVCVSGNRRLLLRYDLKVFYNKQIFLWKTAQICLCTETAFWPVCRCGKLNERSSCKVECLTDTSCGKWGCVSTPTEWHITSHGHKQNISWTKSGKCSNLKSRWQLTLILWRELKHIAACSSLLVQYRFCVGTSLDAMCTSAASTKNGSGIQNRCICKFTIIFKWTGGAVSREL